MKAQLMGGAALVTAAAGDVGRAIASRLATRWAVVLQERREFAHHAEDLAQRLRAAGGRAVVLEDDLDGGAASFALVERAAEAVGPVTLIVNAATHFTPDPGGFDGRSWAELFDVNLRLPWVLAERFAAALPAGASGAVVNIIDQRLWLSEPAANTYELSQAALHCATEMMARAYAPRIRVNAVGPSRAVAAVPAPVGRGIPRLGTGAPDTIAKAVIYLATARNVTGQVIAIDPGDETSSGRVP